MVDGDGVRLSKLMARRGVASRRQAEALIEEGRVSVGGEIVRSVVRVDPDRDEVLVDGRPLPAPPEKVYYLLYKPKGYITGRNDPEGRKSVLDLVEDLAVRVEPVGRLDFDTEGALLLTNDGELANKLTHPSRKVPKRYLAKVYRTPDDGDLRSIRQGVFLEDGRTAPAKARVVDATDQANAWLEITVTEGRYRLIRRMMAQLGHPVSKLRRESFATVSIRNMDRGQLRALTGSEVQRLQDIAEGKAPARSGKGKGKGFAKAKPKKNSIRKKKSRRLKG